MFLSRTLEAIDTPREQANKGSVEKIVNLKGLLKFPWTLMDDVWEEGIFPSSESSWISTNIFFKGPSIFQRKVYWLYADCHLLFPPPRHHVIICHLLAYPLPPLGWWRHLWTERRPINWYLHYITLHYTLHYIRSSLAVCVCMVVFLMKQKVVLILYSVHVRHCAFPSKASTKPILWWCSSEGL